MITQKPSWLKSSRSCAFANPEYGRGKFHIPTVTHHTRASHIDSIPSIRDKIPGPGLYENKISNNHVGISIPRAGRK